MSLYFQENDKPRNKSDQLIAYGNINKSLNNIFWTEQENTPEITELHGTDIKPIISYSKNQVYTCLISAPSGSGKSVLAGQIVGDLLKEDKRIDTVFLLTHKQEDDPAYNDIRKKFNIVKEVVKLRSGKLVESDSKIPVLQKLDITNPEVYDLPVETFKNSIILADDWESGDKKSRDGIQRLIIACLMRGRSQGIHVITIIHTTLQAQFTRDLHFESKFTILYPKFQIKTTNAYLKNYMGFDDDDLKFIKKLKTRSIYIHKQVPNYLISSDCIKLL